jgi:hypothetical protein
MFRLRSGECYVCENNFSRQGREEGRNVQRPTFNFERATPEKVPASVDAAIL